MSKMIQIRNVPDDLHLALKVRAAKAGMSLSEFLTRELERIVDRRPISEVLAEAVADPIDVPREVIIQAIHDGRAGR